MEPEVCSITGEDAYASFKDGFGSGWYGSRYDMTRLVDVSRQLSGPICDDAIDERVKDGTIRAFESLEGPGKASTIGRSAAKFLFAHGVGLQVARLDNAPTPRSVTLRDGNTRCRDFVNQYDVPDWFGFVMGLDEGGRETPPNCFVSMGAQWALLRLAKGQRMDPDDIDEAGSAVFTFSMQVEEAQDRVFEGRAVMLDGVPGFKRRELQFAVIVQMPEDGDIGDIDHAIGEGGRFDTTISTDGSGKARIDFSVEGTHLGISVGVAIEDVLDLLPEGYILAGVEFAD